MNLPRQQRELLDKASKDIFGSSSKWQKFLNKGYLEPLTEKITEYIPDENGGEGTTREVEVQVKNKGIPVSVKKYHTVQSILQLMIDLKTQKEAYIAKMKKEQEEKVKKEAEDKLIKEMNENAGGAAIG